MSIDKEGYNRITLEHKDEYTFNPAAEGFNAMGLDYYTLGNHDFNFGYDAILDFAKAMNLANKAKANRTAESDYEVYILDTAM